MPRKICRFTENTKIDPVFHHLDCWKNEKTNIGYLNCIWDERWHGSRIDRTWSVEKGFKSMKALKIPLYKNLYRNVPLLVRGVYSLLLDSIMDKWFKLGREHIEGPFCWFHTTSDRGCWTDDLSLENLVWLWVLGITLRKSHCQTRSLQKSKASASFEIGMEKLFQCISHWCNISHYNIISILQPHFINSCNVNYGLLSITKVRRFGFCPQCIYLNKQSIYLSSFFTIQIQVWWCVYSSFINVNRRFREP